MPANQFVEADHPRDHGKFAPKPDQAEQSEYVTLTSGPAPAPVAVGTRVVVYDGGRGLHGVLTREAHTAPVELLFGGENPSFQVVDVTLDDDAGREEAHPAVVVNELDFEASWHVINGGGNINDSICAGGLNIGRERAEELAEQYGGTVVLGSGLTDPGPVPGPNHQYDPDCKYCRRQWASGESFFPAHNASSRCKSGGHAHCTCDTCF